MSRNRGKFPPFTGAAQPADYDQLAVSRLGRGCRGGSLAPRGSFGTGLTVKGSPMWPADGEEDNGGEAVIGSVDKRLPKQNRGLVSSGGRRGSSSYSCLGQRSTGDDGRQ
jgi:hypothetical protein